MNCSWTTIVHDGLDNNVATCYSYMMSEYYSRCCSLGIPVDTPPPRWLLRKLDWTERQSACVAAVESGALSGHRPDDIQNPVPWTFFAASILYLVERLSGVLYGI